MAIITITASKGDEICYAIGVREFMAQVIIVSNRLPLSVKKVDGKLQFYPSLGGLATGLSSYVNDRKSIWVGWPGIASEELSEQEKKLITSRLGKQHCVPVFLTKRQIDDYYNGYSNSVLWPVFHDLPYKPSALDEKWWRAYREVNTLFSETVLSLAKPKSTIWVHDYQLMLVPQLLRESRTDGHIGFFLHIPFPRPVSLSKIKQAKQLTQGVLGSDLAGFHTTSYSEHFTAACQKLDTGIAGDKQVILELRSVQVTNFPIGVDYEKYARARKSKAVKQAVKRYKQKYGKRRLIVAIDRLEPSKGLVERLKAYRDFLALNPKLHGKVMMVMVAAPSRMDIEAYQQLEKRLQKLQTQINSIYGTDDWQPIDYINRPLPFEEVSALYQLADVAFITPLADGMNLVAKEYVASKRKNGVLILSRTAGAAEELQDALLVNPKDPITVINALQQAFTMPRRELKKRLRNMQKQIASNTINTWASTFVTALQTPVPGTKNRTQTLKGMALSKLLSSYQVSQKRLLFFDYDGSLVPFSVNFESAAPPASVLELLTELAAKKGNEVVIISGRKAADLEAWFGKTKLNLVAEHGAHIKKSGTKNWQTIEAADTQWKKVILPVLEKYTDLTPNSSVEVKPHSLVWHYRAAPPYYAQKYVVTIKYALKPILKKYNLELFQGNKVLEIKDPQVTKGGAVQHWLRRHHDFTLAIGDDYTDEDLFAALPSDAYTVKVGSGRTVASLRLKTAADVITLLKRLAI